MARPGTGEENQVRKQPGLQGFGARITCSCSGIGGTGGVSGAGSLFPSGPRSPLIAGALTAPCTAQQGGQGGGRGRRALHDAHFCM